LKQFQNVFFSHSQRYLKNVKSKRHICKRRKMNLVSWGENVSHFIIYLQHWNLIKTSLFNNTSDLRMIASQCLFQWTLFWLQLKSSFFSCWAESRRVSHSACKNRWWKRKLKTTSYLSFQTHFSSHYIASVYQDSFHFKLLADEALHSDDLAKL